MPIPQRLDFEITELLQDWAELDGSERMSIAQQISDERLRRLLTYGERMASLAVRTSNPRLIYYGLLAIGIGDCRGDWRDNLLIVPLHYNAAVRIGVAPPEIFESAAHVLPDQSANALRGFLRRSAEDRSLATMGYVAGSDADGFRYMRTW